VGVDACVQRVCNAGDDGNEGIETVNALRPVVSGNQWAYTRSVMAESRCPSCALTVGDRLTRFAAVTRRMRGASGEDRADGIRLYRA